VTRASIEERMMAASKKKLVLEHVVVQRMGAAASDLKQAELDDILRYGAAELFEDEKKEQEAKGVCHWLCTCAPPPPRAGGGE
jgi:chromodomain-helicase-DNA-binding protein 4